MKKKKCLFAIALIAMTMIVFVSSALSDTRVNSSLGLLNKCEDIAKSKGGSLDYNDYNEGVVAAYLKAVYDKNGYNISKDEIAEEFDILFDNKDGKFATKSLGSILENMDLDRELKNKIDHNFYGEISTLATIKSKGFYISQNSQKYYDIEYSGDDMHISGCGPISLTMALNMLSGKSVYDAETLALWARNHGYMDPTSGTQWSFVPDFAENQGFNVESVGITSVDQLKKYFDEGAVIVTVMGHSVFTDEGHFIVWVGLDSENKVQVVDPISIYRTNKNWNAEEILKMSKGTFWVIKR